MISHLTYEEKRRHLEHLRERIEAGAPPDAGGLGYIDPPFIPYLARINALDGVCTLQSCTGHNLINLVDGSPYKTGGNLWLRFDRTVWVAFERRIGELVRFPEIERVSRIYPWEEKTGSVPAFVSVDFIGEEHDCFPGSAELITSFLTAVVTAQPWINSDI